MRPGGKCVKRALVHNVGLTFHTRKYFLCGLLQKKHLFSIWPICAEKSLFLKLRSCFLCSRCVCVCVLEGVGGWGSQLPWLHERNITSRLFLQLDFLTLWRQINILLFNWVVVSALRDHQISRNYFFFELSDAGTQSALFVKFSRIISWLIIAIEWVGGGYFESNHCFPK